MCLAARTVSVANLLWYALLPPTLSSYISLSARCVQNRLERDRQTARTHSGIYRRRCALSCRGHPDARARAEISDTDIPPPPLRLPPSDLGPLNPPIIFFYSLHSTVWWSPKSEWTLRLSAKGRVSTAPPNKALTRSYKYPTHLLASKAHSRSAHRSEVQPFSFPGSGRKQ